MRRRTWTSFALAAFWLCRASVAAQVPGPAAGPLTLDAALVIALDHNKTIAAARLQRPIDQAGVDVARERPNPDLSYEATRETPRQAIGLSVPIELGGKRAARTSLAQATVATGDAELAQTIASVRDDVRRTYVGLAGAERRLTISEDVVGLFARARDAAHARFESGDAPRRDDVAAQSDYLVAQNDVIAARGDISALQAKLNVLLGQPLGSPIALADGLDPGPVPTLAAALDRANQVNTDLAVFDRRLAEQTARIDIAKSLRTPDVAAGGGVSFGAQPDFSVGWRASFGITLPLFSTHKAGVVLETAEMSRLRADREAALADISAAVASALAQATTAAERFTVFQRDILPLTQQDEDFAQEAYQAGQTGLDALILALQHARERRLGALQAAVDFHLALADLERAIGGPLR